jgi:cytochrome c oxidase subunit 2
MKQIPASLLTLIAGILITLISFWVGQNSHLLPVQASEQAPLVDDFFKVMLTIATALFLVVQGAILLFTIIFRRRKGDDADGLPIEGNFSLEILWTAIPSLIVIGLGIYSVEVYQQMGGFAPATSMVAHMHSGSSHAAHMPGSAMAAPLIAEADAAPPADNSAPSTKLPTYGIGATPAEKGKTAAVTVDVTGMQYAWLFNYPETGITTGELHVPVGQDVQLNLAAKDVIHSFWVPQFRLKQDAIPGEHTELRFVATKIGSFPIVCTELCGSYHGSMRTQVVVQTPDEYQQWVQENQVAQATHPNQTVAANPAELSTSEFLAPYAQEMGVDSTSLNQLHASHAAHAS